MNNTYRNLEEITAAEFKDTFCKYCQRLDLLEMLNEPLFMMDIQTGTILFMNQKARVTYGYLPEEVGNLHITHLNCSSKDAVEERILDVVLAQDKGHIYIANHARKNGEVFKVQVNSRHMKLHGKNVIAALVQDITPDMRIKEEVILAGKIQKRLLPLDICNGVFSVKSIYQPYSHISGDLYDFGWNQETGRLSGFLIDVMGHGMATALQTATLKVLFRQAMEKTMPLSKKMCWINREVMPYFAEDSFTAAILFDIDFERKVLTYATGGINSFLAVSQKKCRLVKEPGSFVGMFENLEYEEHSMPFTSGDRFFFMTDGLSDILPENLSRFPMDINGALSALLGLTQSPGCKDDATAVCFEIK